VGAEKALNQSAPKLNMSPREPNAVVIGSEALRLKVFLLAHKLPMPRVLHSIARSAADAVDERVSERLLVDALDAAMRKLRRPSLPVEFGASIRPADMGIYGMAILAAPTVGDALERSVRFQRLMTNTARIYLEQNKDQARWVWSCTQARTLGVRVRNEIVLAEHVAIVRALSPGASPRRVSFVHHAPKDFAAHVRFFNCPVAWSADQDGVAWANDGLRLTLGTDPALGMFIDQEANRRLKQLPASGSLAEVKDAIQRQLPHGDVNLATIAALLGRPPRSLRRELARGGCTYRHLVDSLRQQRALDLFNDGSHSMTDISLKLGFSEVSAFGRAWRRWFKQPYRASSKH
jgi:AraC-like DNA-binding protein